MLKKVLPKGEFSRNVLTLLTGTSIAQAIPIAMAPIIARIFSPEDIGVFTLYISISTIFSVIATGRYELAIILPKTDEDATIVMILSLAINFIISFLMFFTVLLFNQMICTWLNNDKISLWLYFIPLAVLLNGFIQTFNYWFNRKKAYNNLSISKISQTASSNTFSFVMGISKLFSSGLIVGQLIGQMCSSVYLFWASEFRIIGSAKRITYSQLREKAILYKNFPIYNSFTSLLDKVTSGLPVIFITKIFENKIAGFYGITERIIFGPASLVSYSLSQVLIENISYAHKNGISYKAKIQAMLYRLFLIGIVPFSIFVFFSDSLFVFFLGANWLEAGNYAKILSIAFFARFVVSPLSVVFIATNKLQVAGYWQIIYFLSALLVVYFGYIYHDIMLYFVLFTLNEVIMYGLYLFLILKVSK